MTQPDKTIRALERGLSVVECLAQRGQMSLADLRRATGLANPTLLRVLGTLQARGWVRRNIVEGRYELSHSLGSILGESSRAHPLAEIAGPILLDLKGRQAGLPSDLCALMGPARLEIIESTRLRGPMAPTRTALGIRPSMALSAHGRAILAYSGPQAVTQHMAALRASAHREELAWLDSGQLEAAARVARVQGFGLREPGYWQAPFDPGPELGAMAVPILSATGVHGSVSVLWILEDMTLDEVLDFGALDDLRRAAARIGAALDRAGIVAPAIGQADRPQP